MKFLLSFLFMLMAALPVQADPEIIYLDRDPAIVEKLLPIIKKDVKRFCGNFNVLRIKIVTCEKEDGGSVKAQVLYKCDDL